MRVLVTRARDDAARTAARLAAAGHEAILAPVIEIVATGASQSTPPVDAILATSVHALAGIDRLPEALAGAPWLVVGERLAEILTRRGFGAPEIVARDVAMLCAEIDARYPEPFRFLYLAGRDRKPDLERHLATRGHSVAVVETYEARAVETLDRAGTAALRAGIDAVLHFSRRSADLFVARTEEEQLAGIAGAARHIAISDEAAAPLIAQGWRVEIADAPDEASMLHRLDDEVRA